MNRIREGYAYVQVRRDPHTRNGLRVIKATQRDPEVIEAGAVVIKMKIRLDDAAFNPLRPAVDVDVPLTAARAVEVEVDEPDDEEPDDEELDAVNEQFADDLDAAIYHRSGDD